MISRLTAMLLAATAGCACANTGDRPEFQTSDRCIACHNELTTAKGEDVSIGFAWRSSIMANSSRDPYWQASVRRETLDHRQATAHIEDECSVCHMPITRYLARAGGRQGQVFSHLPFDEDRKQGREAADGVSCSVCHQIGAEKLGTKESFNGGFVVVSPESGGRRPEFGPFSIEAGQERIMRTSTGGFRPTENTDHIRKSELCATCHTLYTTAFGPDGKAIGSLPEQVPYQEWLQSEYKDKQTCQDCHMPVVEEPAPITRVFGVMRDGMKRHVFVAANFFMLRMLDRFRHDLETDALPQELDSAANYTVDYLQQRAARVSIENARVSGGRVLADVVIENRNGHKLPTAYPARRSWIHFTVRDASGRALFESGALRPDGSIAGNDNDADPARFEPHYDEITSPDQVQIYEDILGDPQGRVTTGLLTGIRYLKDNRLLPRGFDKRSADKDTAVIGDAQNDANFVGGSDRVHYSVSAGAAAGLRIEVELWYQPIGFRWAHNLEPYGAAAEPARFVRYYVSMEQGSAVVLARAAAAL
jgi:hypothetical protein